MGRGLALGLAIALGVPAALTHGRELDQFDIGRVIQSAHHTRWPKPGEEIVVVVPSVARHSRESALIGKPPAQPLPLEIEFSAPVEDETDVRLDTRIRVQFSRDVERASLNNRIRLNYSQSDSAERGEAQPPALDFTIDYDRGTRGLEIKPRQRLERFRNVKLELLEGIVGTDGSVLKPWTLNFTTGGS